ncbi:MAG: YqcI/YcgG family protein [Chitinophagales bacterium]|nr:YqcI/YcgG family protein [Chitinophagales bacterium]
MYIENPFRSKQHLKNSKYYAIENGQVKNNSLRSILTDQLVYRPHNEVFRYVASKNHYALGVNSSYHSNCYRLGVYEHISSDNATAGLAHDLMQHVQDHSGKDQFVSFIATFLGKNQFSEREFSILMWQQLYKLHQLDKEHFAWDHSVSQIPTAQNNGFSFGGKGFLVTGLHANSLRSSRTFAYPVIIFNLHAHLKAMHREGTYQKLSSMIRKRA